MGESNRYIQGFSGETGGKEDRDVDERIILK
jgi:hypothetical protein